MSKVLWKKIHLFLFIKPKQNIQKLFFEEKKQIAQQHKGSNRKLVKLVTL